MVRTPSCDKNGMKKGTWTPEEDRKLVAYVTRYGCWNWRQLPKFAGLKRCGKSCRLRWMNYLRPNVKRGNYTKEEEEIIIKLHQSMGNKWSTIAAQLPGRTDNEVKNYWHTNLKKRVVISGDLNNSPSEEHETSDSVESPDDNLPGDHDGSFRPGPAALTSSSSVVSSDSDLVTRANYSVAESSYNNNNNNDNDNPFEAYSGFSDDFWTVPFLADDSYLPSDFLDMDTEFMSTELFDANCLLFAEGTMYLEHSSS